MTKKKTKKRYRVETSSSSDHFYTSDKTYSIIDPDTGDSIGAFGCEESASGQKGTISVTINGNSVTTKQDDGTVWRYTIIDNELVLNKDIKK